MPHKAPDAAHAARMDAIYRWQRHIYDATRKYFLFGRDRLIDGLAMSKSGGTIFESACGTGRNLALVHKRWPQAQLFGLDISAEMLISARAKLGLAAVLVEGDACAIDPVASFGRTDFDRVVISYALSMIPDWRAALAQGADLIAPGGALHIVDFGDAEGLPAPLRELLKRWLAHFEVTPRVDLFAEAERLAVARGLHLTAECGPFGYFHLLVLRRAA